MKEKQEVTEESQEYAKKLKEEHQEFVDRQERLKHKEQEKSPYAPPGSPYRAEDDGREHRRRKVRRADERPQGKRAGRPASTLKRYLRSLPFWTFVIPCLFVLLRYIHNRVDLISDTRKIETHLYPRYAPEADKEAAEEDETERPQETEEEAYGDDSDNAASEDDIERAIAVQDAEFVQEETLEDSICRLLQDASFGPHINIMGYDPIFYCAKLPSCFVFDDKCIPDEIKELSKEEFVPEYVKHFTAPVSRYWMADNITLIFYQPEVLSIAPGSRTDDYFWNAITEDVDNSTIVQRGRMENVWFVVTEYMDRDEMMHVMKKFIFYEDLGDVIGGYATLVYPRKYNRFMRDVIDITLGTYPMNCNYSY